MVIDYAGYAPLLKEYVKVPFAAKAPENEFVQDITPRTPSCGS